MERRKFSREFKLEAIKLVKERGCCLQRCRSHRLALMGIIKQLENTIMKILTMLFLALLVLPAASSFSAGPSADFPSKPIVYGLIIDNTDRKSIDDEIAIGTFLVNSNGPADETYVIRFTNSDNITVIQDLTTQKAALTNALDNMFVESGSPAVLDAINLAAQFLAEQEKVGQLAQGRRALVLIAHGADLGSYYQIDAVLSMLQKKAISVYVIGVNADEEARTFLEGLAKRSEGAAYFPESKVSTEKAAEEILSAIGKK